MLTPDCSRSAAIGGNEPANCGSRLLPKGPYLRHRVMLITARLGGFHYPSEGNGRFRRNRAGPDPEPRARFLAYTGPCRCQAMGQGMPEAV